MSDIRIEPQQHVQMIVHGQETSDAYRDDSRSRVEPVLDPLLAIVISFPQQGVACTTERNRLAAMIPLAYDARR